MKSIKTLGIATAMALALTAFVGVAAASASQFTAPGAGAASTTWDGSLTGKEHVLSLGSDAFTCSKVAFSGSMGGEASTQVVVAPELNGCLRQGNQVGWATNGCDFRLLPGLGSENQTTGTLDIVGCEKAMSFAASGCSIEIGNQNGVGTVKYENVAPNTIRVSASLNSIEYTRSGCAGYSDGTFTNGTYVGEWNVKGSRLGTQVTIKVEGTSTPNGFVAEEAPVTISGAQAGLSKKLGLGDAGTLTCESYALNGTSASSNSAALSLVPTYSKCKFGSETIPDSSVSAGGCSYVFSANGGVAIAGTNCASNPITIVRTGCTVTVGPQSGLAINSMTPYVNEGSAKLRTVSIASGAIAGVKYTASGASCGGEGTFTKGNLFSSSKLTASNSGGKQQGLWVE